MSGRVYGELAGIIGKAGIEVQIGDRLTQIHADVRDVNFVGVSPDKLKEALRPRVHRGDDEPANSQP